MSIVPNIKRLLYFKASKDNEYTLNSVSFSFVEEIAKHKADSEQIMIGFRANYLRQKF